MRVAVVYNRESQRVINLFGLPNREKYGLEAITRITDALKKGGHQVIALEGDKDLIDRLEEFMPQVLKGEIPGMVFNLSYGIQGQARYTHVPGMLEMLGLPYVGSGPLAHSLALDKVVSKMLFRQHDLPTPDFAVMQSKSSPIPDLDYPLIVKPKHESVSFGTKIVYNDSQLRKAAGNIFDEFDQPVLVEKYIDGREINVGILGNSPPEALPPAEIAFGDTGPRIYTYADKKQESGREISVICPADFGRDLLARAQDLALKAFGVIGCFDCARIDMRVDKDGNLYILELNSLPSLNLNGSYVHAAAEVGLDFDALVNRLVDVAAARYFGTPSPPSVRSRKASSDHKIVSFLTQQRDNLEDNLKKWTMKRSRTSDRLASQELARELHKELQDLGMRPVEDLTDSRVVWTWQSPTGFDGGTLLVGHFDVPLEPEVPPQPFRLAPEVLYGEGIGSSRAPLVSMLFALKALKHVRHFHKNPIGVLFYADEGRDCRFSEDIIRKAVARARNVLVLRPGNPPNKIITERRGQSQYDLTIEGEPFRLGIATRQINTLRWAFKKLDECARLSSRKNRIAVATKRLTTDAMPLYVPHQVKASLLVTYPDEKIGADLEDQIREILKDRTIKCKLQLVSSRPPMRERRSNTRLINALKDVAGEWEIPLSLDKSVWPSVAGLVPARVGAVCGIGPAARDLYTPHECVERISLLRRTLLIAQFLNKQFPKKPQRKKGLDSKQLELPVVK